MTKQEALKKIKEIKISEEEIITFMDNCKLFPNDYRLIKSDKDGSYEFEFMKNKENYKVIISNIGCTLIRKDTTQDLSLWYYLSLANQRKDKEFTNLVNILYQKEIDNLITKYYNKSILNSRSNKNK